MTTLHRASDGEKQSLLRPRNKNSALNSFMFWLEHCFHKRRPGTGLRGVCLVSEVIKPSTHLGSLDESCCVPLFVLSCITGLKVACFNVSLFSLKAQ